ncbi:MAG: hypothetical protein R3362_00350 [Rhodothermales bacterium]|nr:hypothetical protein [Rhodothermales bacterium]
MLGAAVAGCDAGGPSGPTPPDPEADAYTVTVELPELMIGGRQVQLAFLIRTADGEAAGGVPAHARAVRGGDIISAAERTDDLGFFLVEFVPSEDVAENVIEVYVGSDEPEAFTLVAHVPVRIAEAEPTLRTLLLRWPRNVNPGFVRYRLTRRNASGSPPGDTVLTTSQDEGFTAFEDGPLPPGTSYLYRVDVELADEEVVRGPELHVHAGVHATLAGEAQDVVLDEARGRLYVAVYNRSRFDDPVGEIAVLDPETLEVLHTLAVADGTRNGPVDLERSADGQTLYAAVSGAGTVLVIDLDTFDADAVDVTEAVGHEVLYGVVEHRPGHAVVWANTVNGGSPGSDYVYLAEVDVTDGLTVRRLPNSATEPFEYVGHYTSRIVADPDGEHLLALNRLSSGRLLRLRLTEDGLEYVGQRFVSPFTDVDQESEIVAFGSGELIEAASLETVGTVDRGLPAFAAGGDLLYQFPSTRYLETGDVRVIDVATQAVLRTIRLDAKPGAVALRSDEGVAYFTLDERVFALALD